MSWESSIANIVDLGTSTFPFKDYYGEGNINLGNINSRIGLGLAYGANTRGAVEVDAFLDYNGAPFNFFIPNGVAPTGYPIGVSDYQDAMKDIRKERKDREQMDFKREQASISNSNKQEEIQIKREDLAARREIADKQLQIARENKNRYDNPKGKPKE